MKETKEQKIRRLQKRIRDLKDCLLAASEALDGFGSEDEELKKWIEQELNL